jgi:hypothetical protein
LYQGFHAIDAKKTAPLMLTGRMPGNGFLDVFENGTQVAHIAVAAATSQRNFTTMNIFHSVNASEFPCYLALVYAAAVSDDDIMDLWTYAQGILTQGGARIAGTITGPAATGSVVSG